ncbi:unnamed protein product [Rotaria socialis]|uniref:RING-type domain-containing protein n=1 Tax=Rotaria socialis TaxID=392032 RepID=A0A818J8B2_9BILA|nr:unnamed protein product [Rotaria socialis]CAF4235432.1 unnamed protein product [Rotaria socialis]
MAAGQASNFLVDNVNKILSVYVPSYGRQGVSKLLTSMGVKSYGTITFPDNKSHQAEFIRIPADASVMDVKKFLNQDWYSERPSLVISITGGAKEYKMQHKVLRAFRRGLLKVARTTGAWIITGGMNTGIMKLVGEIVQINPDRSRPIPLIGIGTWGCVSGFKDLEVEGGNVNYAKARSDRKGEAPLEPNHTKFIFVDNGLERTYGGEIAFRAKLEQAISGGFFSSKTLSNTYSTGPSLSATSSLRPDNSGPVPVVLLVIEGGPNTVRTVKEAVVGNNIPAVLLEGTGRCCDLFAKACQLYDKYCRNLARDEITARQKIAFYKYLDQNILQKRQEEIKIHLREDLKDELRKITGLNDSSTNVEIHARADEIAEYYELVYACISTRRNFLNIISLNSRNPVEPDIDLVILQALLNATSGSDMSKPNVQRKREQLHLALEWNRVDIAKKYIMKNETDWNIDLNDLFLTALKNNQTEFVKLFLDHDFSLTDLFRDTAQLLALYPTELVEIHGPAKSQDPLRIIYENIIQPFVGDLFDVDAALQSKNLTSNSELNDENEDEISSCCGMRRYRMPAGNRNGGGITQACGPINSSINYLDVDRELFLWSVMTSSQDLALLFWSRGKNKVCAALIATLLYKKRVNREGDNIYNQWADDFEGLAVKILDQLYQVNPAACAKAIIRQIPTYGNANWLELAIAADAKKFIAQRAVQDLLNDIWFGYIDQRVANMSIIFCTFLPCFSGFLTYHDELVTANERKGMLDDSIDKPQALQRQASRQKRMADRPGETFHMKLLSGVHDVDNSPVEFVAVGCFDKTTAKVYRYFSNCMVFLHAPYVKYLYNLYFHMIFLLLFSYVMLFDFFPLYDYPVDVCAPSGISISRTEHIADNNNNNGPIKNYPLIENQSNVTKSISHGLQRHSRPSVFEFLLLVWVFTLVCEEIRQLFSIEAQSMRNVIRAYFKIFWNKLDVLAIVLFFVGFALRFFSTSECYCAARIVLSFDLAIWFIRSLDMFTAVKRLGPKLVMIGEMVNDLWFFMLMLTVFILAFGVSFYGLVHGVQEFSWHIPREILNLAFWQIFGELNALEIFENNYRPNGYAAFVFLIAYMAIVSILLVNLLIAMFSNTFDRLQSDTDRIWKFQRYSLVREYLSRPALPPPFIFFPHVWRLILHLSVCCCKSQCIQNKYSAHANRIEYKTKLNIKSSTNIEIAEDALGDEVYYNYLKVGGKLDDETYLDEERVQSPQENVFNRIRTIEKRVEAMSSQQDQMCVYLDHLMEGLKVIGGERIKMPERRRLDPEESFDEASNPIEQTKRQYLGDILSEQRRSQGSSNADEQPSTIFNFFPTYRNMSENSPTSIHATNVNNNNNSNPTSDTGTSSVPFTLKRWNLVGIWSWDVAHDVCAICRTALSESCLRCQAASNLQECIIVWGTCNHSFHNCCMSQWVKQRAQCPLCQTDWVINRIGQ